MSVLKWKLSSNQRWSRFLRAVTPGLLWVLVCFQTLGAQPSAVFDQANKLYYEEKYPEAAAAYRGLLREGQVSPALFYNLGNALFKSGQIGRAIVSFRLAEQLAPRDPDIQANLQFARSGIVGSPTRRANLLGRLLNIVTVNELTVLFACSIWICFGLLGIREFRPELRRAFGVFPKVSAAACVLLGLWLGAHWNARLGDAPAVVIATEAVARYGPLDESQSAFTVRDGAELTVVDRKDEWLQVKDASARLGWMRAEHVARVVPESVLNGS